MSNQWIFCDIQSSSFNLCIVCPTLPVTESLLWLNLLSAGQEMRETHSSKVHLNVTKSNNL